MRVYLNSWNYMTVHQSRHMWSTTAKLWCLRSTLRGAEKFLCAYGRVRTVAYVNLHTCPQAAFNYSRSAQLVPWRLVGGFLLAVLFGLRCISSSLVGFSTSGRCGKWSEGGICCQKGRSDKSAASQQLQVLIWRGIAAQAGTDVLVEGAPTDIWEVI